MALFTSRKRWEDLTQQQRISIVVMGVIQFALLAAALVDIRQRSEEELTASKRTWTMISFINYVGPIAYFLFGRKE
jgi:flagellar biosynthesis/type III secretory pathway M-ring protein FliF/YscJ